MTVYVSFPAFYFIFSAHTLKKKKKRDLFGEEKIQAEILLSTCTLSKCTEGR